MILLDWQVAFTYKEYHVDKQRQQITIVFVALVVVLALTAIVAPTANHVLNQLLPALMLILGYYFGQKR
jgi:hypothetical protein